MSSIRDLTGMIEEIKQLKEMNEDTLLEPLAEGKWSVREIVGHLYNWDAHNTSNMVPFMEDGAQLPAFPSHDSFNEAGLKGLENVDVYTLINHFISQRAQFIETLEAVDPSARFTIGKGKRKFSAESFAKIFVHHDQEHRPQLREKADFND
ncbi:DinB family protein [Shouchella lehensis]|uniref:DinB family protein n=1 Tax=Shouchella lehensis TaxID=300825 RepID=A0A4Y7WFV2_9BACI|nr:DinB family protein [Shouchella lehensis]TES46497.1 DinB family protein [Shouchella lehensis]